MAAVAAGADDVEQSSVHLEGHFDQRGDGEHRVEQTVELLDRLALHAQRNREAGDLSGTRRAFEDLGHRRACLVVGQVTARRETAEHGSPSAQRLEARFPHGPSWDGWLRLCVGAGG